MSGDAAPLGCGSRQKRQRAWPLSPMRGPFKPIARKAARRGAFGARFFGARGPKAIKWPVTRRKTGALRLGGGERPSLPQGLGRALFLPPQASRGEEVATPGRSRGPSPQSEARPRPRAALR